MNAPKAELFQKASKAIGEAINQGNRSNDEIRAFQQTGDSNRLMLATIATNVALSKTLVSVSNILVALTGDEYVRVTLQSLDFGSGDLSME